MGPIRPVGPMSTTEKVRDNKTGVVFQMLLRGRQYLVRESNRESLPEFTKKGVTGLRLPNDHLGGGRGPGTALCNGIAVRV